MILLFIFTPAVQCLSHFFACPSFPLNLTLLYDAHHLLQVCFGVHQENETLAKIGSSCLQQLVESNATKMLPSHWMKVCETIVALFNSTTPSLLLDEQFSREVIAKADVQHSEDDVAGSLAVTTKKYSDASAAPALIAPSLQSIPVSLDAQVCQWIRVHSLFSWICLHTPDGST